MAQPMVGGDGAHSYAKNSSGQVKFYAKTNIKEK